IPLLIFSSKNTIMKVVYSDGLVGVLTGTSTFCIEPRPPSSYICSRLKMIKLNRTTEYGLMALRHMNQKSKAGPELTSAREVADVFGLPFEITAKTLQRMKEIGLIHSSQGA